MKASQAFAAFRTSLITDLNHAILNELVPEFNSRCEDIRRRVDDDFKTYHNQAKSDNFKKTLVYDLVLHRKTVLEGVQKTLSDKITKRLEDDQAAVRTEEISEEGKKPKTVMIAEFPDKSSARVPMSLWIDYSAFDRV